MSALELPRTHLGSLQELGTRLLDSRKPRSEDDALARSLLLGFHEICLRVGLDRLLVALDPAGDDGDVTDSTGLADHAPLRAALVAQPRGLNLDGGGPRNARPRQLADAVVTALGLELVDPPSDAITLDGKVRSDVSAALASVIDVELALPRLREAIIAKGRALCDAQYHRAFDLIAAQLDARGMRLEKHPKVPVDALHAVQRVLYDARNVVIGQAATSAIDRARHVLEAADPAVAARIDQPVTHRLTPREVAVLRACDARLPKQPDVVVTALLDGLTELARITWRAAERAVRAYGASQTFAVGELLEHPKFGRGTVVATLGPRIDVEFADGKRTLVHAPVPR